MKKILIAAAFAAVLPQLAAAQVEKQVEVTKAYVPKVESASKLAVEPDMTDTARMRPEIDYTITPLSLRTTLSTRPIRPATVTYWEFNRPLPFYVKAGAGYPLNSVLDFYASSQNPSTGYIVGYINHEGQYAKIKNNFGVKNNSTRMFNRIGAAAGKYFGRHILEGDIYYDNRMYHRYGAYAGETFESLIKPGGMNDYGDANVAVRFGDNFQDLSRTNFEIALRGGFFFDHSEWPEYNDKARQTTLEARAKIARGFGRSHFSLEAGYERLAGQKSISERNQQLIHAALRYGFAGGVVRLDVGADYYHDRLESGDQVPDSRVKSENYIIPYARLDFNLGTPGLKPFFEADGAVKPNDFRALTLENPYVASSMWLDKSSVDYNFRLGLGGSLWRSRFNYRVYAGVSIRDNHLYWTNMEIGIDPASMNGDVVMFQTPFEAVTDRQTVTSFNGEIEFRPVSVLKFDLGVHGYLYNDETDLKNGAPSFEGNLGVAYEGRKVSFGVKALMQSGRSWTTLHYLLQSEESGLIPLGGNNFEAPFAVDLRVNFDWKVSGRVTLFAEGRNLINRRLYEYPWYPELGANFTVGIKANF